MHLIVLSFMVMMYAPLRNVYVPSPNKTASKTTLKKDKNGRFIVFDVMRGTAIMAVIIIHVVYLFPENTNLSELTLAVINSSMRFALPIFYVTSGILLKPPKKTFHGYIFFMWNKILAIMPAYILVNIFLAFVYHMSFNTLIHNILTGQGSPPFYFVIILFQLYTIYPFIEKVSKKKWFVYFVFAFSFLFQFIPQTWYMFGGFENGAPTAMRFLFFFVWGIYMKDMLLNGKLKKDWLGWSSIVLSAITFYIILPGMYYNMRPFYGIGIMMLIYMAITSNLIKGKMEKVLSWIGSMTLWIFLTHFPLMEYVLHHLYSYTSSPGWIVFICTTLVSLSLSILLGYICTKTYGFVTTAPKKYFTKNIEH